MHETLIKLTSIQKYRGRVRLPMKVLSGVLFDTTSDDYGLSLPKYEYDCFDPHLIKLVIYRSVSAARSQFIYHYNL